ncbi:TetR/AcrR family transcriptional regulator [Dyella flagellata]|uniref:TetR/AcrR family transcriptional regulator n=1 Tax=Dyella flagellata TaxID=1867833 RepID=UPI0024E11CBE|nr:TetR/AcrR family transcriptional regulator [Dyella flagellata]
METGSTPALNPRKLPRQGRSIATVNAIFEATAQVLLSDGPVSLNTTRVARRAGVSIGTLYQYFPNKQALLFATLERYMTRLVEAIENACSDSLGTTVDLMAGAVVKAYLKAKMAQSEISPALYQVAMELDPRRLAELATQRSEKAIEAMLCSAGDDRPTDPHVVAQTMTAAIYGTVPAFCPRVLSPVNGREAEKQLTIMFRSYLSAQQATSVGQRNTSLG